MPFSLSALDAEEAEQQASCLPEMTWSDRIKGFIACCAAGFLCSILSWVTLALGKYVKYSVLMTMGNLISLASSGFLVGPTKQFANMFDEKRRVATSVYIATLIGTMIAAFAVGSAILAILCCGAQYAALIWYCASYIPYGREMLLGCVKGAGRCCQKTISI
eukprot:TRINITY_DN47889_c0_g1_i1.p3 TRINITY_DN47889_c0_g1~~TRINITY_DN47889_c0_g1_i1.p3  ORF type:complete len:187 (+),score=64.83 TRINITY_DN47889_c0_g1_i1:77-562(+)